MSFIIGVIVAAINYWLLSKKQEIGIIVYCILLECCPVSIIGSLSLEYSYISLPFLLIWYLSHNRSSSNINKVFVPLYILLGWELLASLYSLNIGIADTIGYTGILGQFKSIFICFILAKQETISRQFLKILTYILIINAFVIIAEFFLKITWSATQVAQFWLRLYGTLGNSGSLQGTIDQGFEITRLHGTFSSSAFPGILSMIGLGVFLLKYFNDTKWSSVFMLLLSIFIGFSSSSKRFFLGSFAILIACFILRLFWIKRRKLDYKLPLVAIVIIFSLVGLYSILGSYFDFDFYLEYLYTGNVEGAFESRFSEDRGVVNGMIPYIEKYWWIGLGVINIKDLLITDSLYYVTLFRAGIVGLMAHIYVFLKLFARLVRKKHVFAFIVFFDIVMEFFISTAFFSKLNILLLAYVVNVAYGSNSKLLKNGK